MSDMVPFDDDYSSSLTVEEEALLWIKRELGYPTIHLEVTDAQIEQAIGNALRTFNNYMFEGQFRVAWEQGNSSNDGEEEISGISTGNVVIQLEDGVRGVTEVRFFYPESTRSLARINIFEIIYRMVFPSFPVGDWYLFRSYYDMFQEVRGTSPDWRFDEFTKKLYLDLWSGPYDVFYVVAVDLTVDSLRNSKAQYWQKFLDLALARTKLILAKIRGKFTNTIPAPGGSVSTDADVLRQEGEETQKEVIDWLKKMAKFTKTIQIG